MSLQLPSSSRRGFLGFLLAAPAIVTAAHIMPVKMLSSISENEFIPELFEPTSSLLTPSIIAREFARIVARNLTNKGTIVQRKGIFKPSLLQQKHVDFQFSSAERTLPLDQFCARIIEPAANVMAGAISYNAKAVRMYPLDLPSEIMEAAREQVNNVEVRLVSDYFIGTDSIIFRFDIQYSIESGRGVI